MKIKHGMKLLVAVGKSRMAKSWQNREIQWSELLDKLSTTTRTQETVAEYAAMSKPKRSKDHPTMKPIPLLAYPLQNSTVPNAVVLDIFGGSGSTMIACEQTSRI